jgi:hypothetical protein
VVSGCMAIALALPLLCRANIGQRPHAQRTAHVTSRVTPPRSAPARSRRAR